MSDEILIVSSKVKKYIKDTSGFSTSANTILALSNKVKEVCDKAIEQTKKNKRKTVMDKDLD